MSSGRGLTQRYNDTKNRPDAASAPPSFGARRAPILLCIFVSLCEISSLLRLALACAFAFSIAAAGAVEPDEILKDPALEARARAVTQELRCVVCQNQSVDDSDAPLARDIRILVRERIAKGDSDAQARDYVVARYGNYVLLRPPLQTDTLILWFGPGLLLLGALALAWMYIARLKRAPAVPHLSPEEEDAVRRLVEDEAGRR
jgi:cytochrome c-type biogenesis protein CcmH